MAAMTETSSSTPPRAAFGHVDPDAGEVSLPGYLNAVPSIVSPGGTFTVDGRFAHEVDRSPLFEEIALDDVVSPLDAYTVNELLDRLPDEVRDDAPKSPKADVVAFVDTYERANPRPPSADAPRVVPVDPPAPDAPAPGDVNTDTNGTGNE